MQSCEAWILTVMSLRIKYTYICIYIYRCMNVRTYVCMTFLQCFYTVGWVTRRVSGLLKILHHSKALLWGSGLIKSDLLKTMENGKQ